MPCASLFEYVATKLEEPPLTPEEVGRKLTSYLDHEHVTVEMEYTWVCTARVLCGAREG